MAEFLSNLFNPLHKNEALRRDVGAYIDANFDELSPYLPWLAGEIIHQHGAQSLLDFLQSRPLGRIKLGKLIEAFPNLESHKDILLRNNGDSEVFELPSIPEIVEGLRKSHLHRLLLDKTDLDTIHQECGVSLSTIQRAKKRLPTNS